MTLCLYDCLRSTGLQHHYARFTSMGVCSAAHLLGLTIEDYHTLGIHSMEDRTRLFQLIQVLKSSDLESIVFEHGDDEGGTISDSSFLGGYKDKQHVYDVEDESGAADSTLNAASLSKSCVPRHLDFTRESSDCHQTLFYSPGQNDEPVDGEGSTMPVQMECHASSAALYGYKGRYNNSHSPSHHHTGGNSKSSIHGGGGISTYNSQSVPFHKPGRAVAPEKLNSKPLEYKEGKIMYRKKKLFPEVFNDGAGEHVAKPPSVYESKKPDGYNYGLPLSAPSVSNKKHKGEPRICVCVRKRPLPSAKRRAEEIDVVTTLEDCVIVHEAKEAVDLTEYILQHRFYFDQAFGEDTSNEQLYHRTASPLVQHMLNGGKATCFAYGQTGAGKTHTMLGSSSGEPGLYALAARDIFAHFSTCAPPPVYVSFFEIYCGQLYDLLNHRKRLFAREDGQKVVHIAGLRDVRVDSVNSLLEVIAHGSEERTQGVSGVNPVSSRSHALLQIQLRQPNQQIIGRMWFVDLAGSERASDTNKSDRQTRMEGAEINQSLLALKECIRSLDQEQLHTPFRQSKLTQVLKDSFIGNTMTCMIANISPGQSATEHTLNTLRYADRVKELRGQGGPRGLGRCKPSSPKHDLSNSTSSSVGTSGKSPPKKLKTGKRAAFGQSSSIPKMLIGGPIVCSTPRSNTMEEDNWERAKKGIGLQQISPVRGSLVVRDTRQNRQSESKRDDRERDTNEETHGRTGYQPEYGQKTEVCQATAEKLYSWKGPKDEAAKRPVETTGDAQGEVERTRENNFQKLDERNKEREKHLKQYHQQLQQFVLPSDSSSDRLSPSACLSVSLSNQSSLPSFVSPSSNLSDQMYPGFEEVLNVYKARAELTLPHGEISVQSETSPCSGANRAGPGDSGQDLLVSFQRTVEGFGEERGKSEKRRTQEATDQGVVGVQAADWRLAEMEKEEIRWTRMTEQADRLSAAMLRDRGKAVSHNYDSGENAEVGPKGMDAPVDGVFSTEQGGCCGLGKNEPFGYAPAETEHQQAPAERPLSPDCQHADGLQPPDKFCDLSMKSKHTACMPLLLPNPQQVVPTKYRQDKEPLPAANARGRELTTLPLDGCKVPVESLSAQVDAHPEVKAKMSVVPQEETAAVSVSHIMDPRSLLEVDQQAATASLRQGEQSNPSFCPAERKDDKWEGGKGSLICLEETHMETQQVKVLSPTVSDAMTATNLTRGDRCPSVFQMDKGDIQMSQIQPDIETLGKPASPHNTSPYATPQTTSPCLQHAACGSTPIPPEYAHNTHQSEGAILNSDPNHSLQNSNGRAELNGQEGSSNQNVGTIINLVTLSHWNHAQWRVVQAHWEQLEEMEALCCKEGKLICQQPDMAFGEYVHKLEEIMEEKAQCVHRVRNELQLYLKTGPSSDHQHKQDKDDYFPTAI